MIASANGSASGAANPEQLVIVRAEDTVDVALAGRGGAVYESPPQPRDQALALVCLLVGRAVERAGNEARWICPVAGGRRTVSLELAAPSVG